MTLDPIWTETLFDACCAALEWDAESAKANSFFRKTGDQTGTGHKPPNDQDVCYFEISEQAGDIPQMQYIYEQDHMETVTLLPMQCAFVFYGASAYELASQLRQGLMRDTQTAQSRNPRVIMRRGGIYPKQPLPALVRLTENADGAHRLRCDYSFPFMLIKREATAIPTFECPPEIIIKE